MISTAEGKSKRTPRMTVKGRCACGAVEIEFDFPAFWAWHDHSKASQRAHGAAYATYGGCWRSRVRITAGEDMVTRFEEARSGIARSFCAGCGTPLMFERGRAPQMVNLPRALFESRTGREPRYHVAIDERPEWAYRDEALVPLKGYPGTFRERPRKRKHSGPA